MSGHSDAPSPSPEENAINQKILELLNKQEKDTELIKPFLYDQYGIQEKTTQDFTNPDYLSQKQQANDRINYLNSEVHRIKALPLPKTGARPDNEARAREQQIRQATINNYLGEVEGLKKGLNDLDAKFTKTSLIQSPERLAEVAAQKELDTENRKISMLQAQRQEKALAGNLPISEGTTQRKSDEFKLLKENAARLGHSITGDTPESAVSDSTAGSQLLGEFNRRYGLLEDTERRGELDSGTANYLNQYGLTRNLAAAPVGSPPPTINYSGLISGYQGALQPYQYSRGMQFGANQSNAQNRTALASGLLQAIGTGGAAYMFA